MCHNYKTLLIGYRQTEHKTVAVKPRDASGLRTTLQPSPVSVLYLIICVPREG